jgi:hypothetical protein
MFPQQLGDRSLLAYFQTLGSQVRYFAVLHNPKNWLIHEETRANGYPYREVDRDRRPLLWEASDLPNITSKGST